MPVPTRRPMENRRTVLFAGVALLGFLFLGGVVVLRRGSSPSGELPPRTGPQAKPPPVAYTPALVKAAPPPAPPEKIAQATDTVRIRGTYQNYRSAVVSGNPGLQAALLPALLKNRESARQCAEGDLARATTDQDRNIALRVISDLRQ
jgi:hypothetical protein